MGNCNCLNSEMCMCEELKPMNTLEKLREVQTKHAVLEAKLAVAQEITENYRLSLEAESRYRREAYLKKGHAQSRADKFEKQHRNVCGQLATERREHAEALRLCQKDLENKYAKSVAGLMIIKNKKIAALKVERDGE